MSQPAASWLQARIKQQAKLMFRSFLEPRDLPPPAADVHPVEGQQLLPLASITQLLVRVEGLWVTKHYIMRVEGLRVTKPYIPDERGQGEVRRSAWQAVPPDTTELRPHACVTPQRKEWNITGMYGV